LLTEWAGMQTTAVAEDLLALLALDNTLVTGDVPIMTERQGCDWARTTITCRPPQRASVTVAGDFYIYLTPAIAEPDLGVGNRH
jgi:hypothetical protein